mmetsp:Transcript_72142/g.227647  ORF Transcript_72142/g.227647 Transcript_72142/m.227647 type:complete len:232 (-) Transcript_72142:10-705(-)
MHHGGPSQGERDDPPQPAHDGDRHRHALGGLVRLQRGLRGRCGRGRRHGRRGHADLGCYGRVPLDDPGLGRDRQALHAGHRHRIYRGPGCHYPRLWLRGPHRRPGHRHGELLRVPLLLHRAQGEVRLRRLPGRVRRARRRRLRRYPPRGRVLLGGLRRQHGRGVHRQTVRYPDVRCGRHDGVHARDHVHHPQVCRRHHRYPHRRQGRGGGARQGGPRRGGLHHVRRATYIM